MKSTLILITILLGFLSKSEAEFIENKGQLIGYKTESPQNDIKAYFDDDGVRVLFTNKGFAYEFLSNDISSDSISISKRYRIDINFIGVNSDVKIIFEQPLETKTNYYSQYYPDGILGARHFNKLVYEEVYPFIDLVFYLEGENLKYDYIVHPKGDPKMIKMNYVGSNKAYLNEKNDFLVSSPMGNVLEKAPYSYQEDLIESEYLYHNNTLSFKIGKYDNTKDLIIDPTLVWGTYFGGPSSAIPYASYAEAGGFYLTGQVGTGAFHVTEWPGAFYQDTSAGSSSIFVTKFDRNYRMVWSTFYSSKNTEKAWGITLDNERNIYVTGEAFNTLLLDSLPGAYFYDAPTASTAFILKFDKSGVRKWATRIEGTDIGFDIATDDQNRVFIIGTTEEDDLPTVNPGGGAYFQGTRAGGIDNFITGFDANGNMIWSTYFGGSDDEFNSTQSGCPTLLPCGAGRGFGSAIEVDNNGSIILGGLTLSNDFITQDPGGGAYYQSAYGGGYFDGFITKFNSDFSLFWSTYYGGSGTTSIGSSDERISDIAIDQKNNIYAVGKSLGGFVVDTMGGKNQQPNFSGGHDILIAKFGQNGVQQFSTYWGGTGTDEAWGIAVDACENVYIGGSTRSTNFPTDSFPNGYYQTTRGNFGDAMVMRMDSTGEIVWSTYYGGTSGTNENGWTMTANEFGEVLLSGNKGSANSPLFNPGNGAYYQTGSNNAFIAVFNDTLLDVNFGFDANVCLGDPIQFTDSSLLGADSYYWIFGDPISGSLDTSTLQNPSHTYNSSGTYYVELRIKKACQENAIVKPIIITESSVTLGPDTAVCSTDSFILFANTLSSNIKNWSTGDTGISIIIVSSGDYSIEVTDSNGCKGWDTVTIDALNPLLPIIGITGDTIICLGDSIEIGVLDTNNIYNWLPNGKVSPTIFVSDSGNYKIQVSNLCGTVEDSFNISIDIPVLTNFDTLSCGGAAVNLSVVGGESYLWSPGVGLSSTVANSVVANPDSTTNYSLFVNYLVCKPDTFNINVNVFPGPIVGVGKDTTIDFGQSVLLHAFGGVTYTWTNGMFLNNPNIATPEATPLDNTSFIVTIVDSNGCSANDTIMVFVLNNKNIFIPNVFSPNDDGHNDMFKIIGGPFLQYKLIIYDRWGKRVFESNDQNNYWNGTYKSGGVAAEAVYVFRLDVEFYDGEEIIEKGNITLIR